MKPVVPIMPILLALCAMTPPCATAQSALHLDQKGGGIGESVEFRLTGDPGRPYLLWVDLTEVETTFPCGIVTSVGFDFLGVSFTVPGFLGTTKADGTATTKFAIPDDAALADARFSLQALFLDRLDTVSNFTRLTPGLPGTFRDTLDAPTIPLLSGLASRQADGSVILLDTTLPLVHRYTPSLEEFRVEEISCALGLLATTTTLADGRILMSGGIDPATGQPQTRCVLFDPATLECKELAMTTPRAGHAAALLKSGELYLSGGFTNLDFTDLLALFGGITPTAEIFDPVTETFRAAKELPEAKALHSATTNADGKVLVAGGLSLVAVVDLPVVSQLAWTYDGAKDRYNAIPLFLNEPRLLHRGVLLDDKTVLLAGGVTVDFTDFLTSGDLADLKIGALDDGDLWKDNFLGGSFTAIAGLQSGRALPALVALPGAQALVAGGFDFSITGNDPTQWTFDAKSTADRFAARAFTATGSMSRPRIAPIALLLPDGTILVVGGDALGAEVYQP